MINLLYTINFLTNGGPTRVLQNIIKNIDRQKFNITVMTFIDENDENIVKQFKEDNIDVVEFKYKKNLLSIIKDKDKIINKINSIKPNIIHTHGIVSTFLIADKKIKAYKVTTIHNNMFEDYSYTYGKHLGKLYARVHIKCLKYFNETICCSKTSYDSLKNRVKNISYIRNGVDIDKSSDNIRNKIRNQLNIPNDSIVYIYVGVINSRKRAVELVKLYDYELKDNEYLLIVGDGPLKSEAEKVNNPHIKFLGFKNNTIDYFIASDIYTSNSSSEGFSISIIEALACGLFCLLSDIPSHKECFKIDKKYYIGEYFNDKNFKSKKEKLNSKMLNSDKEKIKKFQDEYLSSISMAKQYEDKYMSRSFK